MLQVNAVARPHRAFDDIGTLRNHRGGRGEIGRRCGGLDQAPARRVLVDQHVEIIAVEFEVGDLVLEVCKRRPVRAAGDRIGERRNEGAGLRANVIQHQDRVLRTRVGHHIGRLYFLVLDRGNETALHDHGISGRIRPQAVEARQAVEIALGGGHRAGELVVKEAAAVIEPVRIGGLGAADALGQHAAVGNGEHMQDGIFAAVLRHAVHHVAAVGRGAPPVERHVAGAARLGGIDEHAIAAVLTHEQLEVVGAQRPLRKEGQSAGALHAAGGHGIAGQPLNALEQLCARGQGIEHRAGAIVLRLQVRQPIRVLRVLHPTVGIAQCFAEVGVLHHLDACHRRRRHHRAHRSPAARQQRHRQGAGAAGEKLPAVKFHFHELLRSAGAGRAEGQRAQQFGGAVPQHLDSDAEQQKG